VRNDGTFSFVRIELVDEGSGIAFLTGEMSLADFAAAVTGHGYMPITMETRALEKVGLLSEHKAEVVEFSGRCFRADMSSSQEAREALAPFEVDGWVARLEDLNNWHNQLPGSPERYRVSFHRFVKRPTAPKAEPSTEAALPQTK